MASLDVLVPPTNMSSTCSMYTLAVGTSLIQISYFIQTLLEALIMIFMDILIRNYKVLNYRNMCHIDVAERA